MDEEILVSYGGHVKAATDSAVIEGLLIPFGGPDDLDHDGEFFSAKTDFGLRLPAAVKLFYGHGMNTKVGRTPLAWAQLDLRDDGVYFKADLAEDLEWLEEERDTARKYQALTLLLAQEKVLGASSGAAPHVVVKRPAAKGEWIARWPTAEASVTPRPANARTFGRVTLKALGDLPDPEEFLASLKGEGPLSLAERSEQWLERGQDLLGGYRRVTDGQMKIGRPISAARRERMQQMLEQASQFRDGLAALLAETEPREEAETGDEPAPGMGSAKDDLARQAERLRLQGRAFLATQQGVSR